jgi:hypothetical protein
MGVAPLRGRTETGSCREGRKWPIPESRAARGVFGAMQDPGAYPVLLVRCADPTCAVWPGEKGRRGEREVKE